LLVPHEEVVLHPDLDGRKVKQFFPGGDA
jgi:hypothetical protein